MAVIHPGNRVDIAFPQPLTPADAETMRRIFAFQAKGDIRAAVQAADALDDRVLMGTALAARYLGRFHRSTADELTRWLARYPDHPDMPAIQALLRAKSPQPAAAPPPPAAPFERIAEPPKPLIARNTLLDRNVLNRAQGGETVSALRAIVRTPGVSSAYAAQLRAEIAQALFIRNDDAEALRIARRSLRDISPEEQPALGFYIAGLAAWRLDDIPLARIFFENGARTPAATPAQRAAAAFWAGRTNGRLHDLSAMTAWLRTAAEDNLTLHGLLARRILRLDGENTLPSQADVDAVAATANGWRAFALLQIGQTERADAEFRALWPTATADPAFGRALTIVLSAAGLPETAMEMDAARSGQPVPPAPRLRPAGGFSIDPALVYALTRVESNFNPMAISRAGARGLMQIMPVTAQFLTRSPDFDPERLHDPASNLQLGQRYVSLLARQDGIGDDLIRILASYNAGPGSLLRWGNTVRDQGDPLLFLEAIPLAETRAFVSQTLTWAWIYAGRMHLPAPGLDAMALGEFPRFTPAWQERKLAFSH